MQGVYALLRHQSLRHPPNKDRLDGPVLKIRVIGNVVGGVHLGQLLPNAHFFPWQISLLDFLIKMLECSTDE